MSTELSADLPTLSTKARQLERELVELCCLSARGCATSPMGEPACCCPACGLVECGLFGTGCGQQRSHQDAIAAGSELSPLAYLSQLAHHLLGASPLYRTWDMPGHLSYSERLKEIFALPPFLHTPVLDTTPVVSLQLLNQRKAGPPGGLSEAGPPAMASAGMGSGSQECAIRPSRSPYFIEETVAMVRTTCDICERLCKSADSASDIELLRLRDLGIEMASRCSRVAADQRRAWLHFRNMALTLSTLSYVQDIATRELQCMRAAALHGVPGPPEEGVHRTRSPSTARTCLSATDGGEGESEGEEGEIEGAPEPAPTADEAGGVASGGESDGDAGGSMDVVAGMSPHLSALWDDGALLPMRAAFFGLTEVATHTLLKTECPPDGKPLVLLQPDSSPARISGRSTFRDACVRLALLFLLDSRTPNFVYHALLDGTRPPPHAGTLQLVTCCAAHGRPAAVLLADGTPGAVGEVDIAAATVSQERTLRPAAVLEPFFTAERLIRQAALVLTCACRDPHLAAKAACVCGGLPQAPAQFVTPLAATVKGARLRRVLEDGLALACAWHDTLYPGTPLPLPPRAPTIAGARVTVTGQPPAGTTPAGYPVLLHLLAPEAAPALTCCRHVAAEESPGCLYPAPLGGISEETVRLAGRGRMGWGGSILAALYEAVSGRGSPYAVHPVAPDLPLGMGRVVLSLYVSYWPPPHEWVAATDATSVQARRGAPSSTGDPKHVRRRMRWERKRGALEMLASGGTEGTRPGGLANVPLPAAVARSVCCCDGPCALTRMHCRVNLYTASFCMATMRFLPATLWPNTPTLSMKLPAAPTPPHPPQPYHRVWYCRFARWLCCWVS